MEFIPLYYADKLHILNPTGNVAVCSLWTPPERLVEKYRHNPRVAVVGGLYGNGLQEMLMNLLYNPQITYLLIDGKDIGTSGLELANFFQLGVEPADYYGRKMVRIVGTNRYIDLAFSPSMFLIRIIKDAEFLPEHTGPSLPRVRLNIDLKPKVTYYPSNQHGHQIIADTIEDGWIEIVSRLHRFGVPVNFAKGDRIELLNVKAVINRPECNDLAYGRSLLDGKIPDDQTYSYGNRLCEYFGHSQIDAAITHLKGDRESRRAYMSTWDVKTDGKVSSRGHPCLTSAFFRMQNENLSLTATFRSHNALDGWARNAYGLAHVLEHVAKEVGCAPGALVIISHSLTIDPAGGGLERAEAVSEARKVRMVKDPQGEFTFTRDGEYIVAQHSHNGIMLKEYRAKTAERMGNLLLMDNCISDIGHAIYIGRQLERV